MVLWMDACGDRDDEDSDGKPLGPIPCLSIGWLIENRRTYIKLASELISDGEYQEVTVIPKGMIRAQEVKAFALPEPFDTWRCK